VSLFDFPSSGLPPWSIPPYSYAGWVPTISGHLSFSLVGTDDLRPRCRTLNRSTTDNRRRVVIVHQRRVAVDYPMPNWLTAMVRPSAVQDYLLIGNTASARTSARVSEGTTTVEDSQGILTGLVIVLPKNRNPISKRRRRALLSKIDKLLNDGALDGSAQMGEVRSAIRTAHLDGVLVLSMRFALFRSGEFRLWYDLKEFLGREVHAQAIPPNEVELKSAEAVAPHAYYFVKDITHRHYHHDRETDQLLLLSRLQPASSGNSHEENELRWRRETLWGLARIVAQFRRKNNLDDHKRARGILAYADAFQSSLGVVWRSRDLAGKFENHKRLPLYDFAHTRGSVQSLEDVVTWQKTGLMQFIAIMVGIFLSSLALWGAAIQVRPVVCQVPGSQATNSYLKCEPLGSSLSSEVAIWVADSPLAFISILLVMGFALFSIFIKSPRFFRPGRWIHIGLARLSKAFGASVARTSREKFGEAADWVGYLSTMAFLASLLAALTSWALAFLL
jgi:hypothetical protein